MDPLSVLAAAAGIAPECIISIPGPYGTGDGWRASTGYRWTEHATRPAPAVQTRRPRSLGQFLDRDIRFMLLAEGDARQFLPALARLGNKIVYMGDETVSASRLPTIRTVLRRSPIGSEIQERSNRELFRDLFEEGPGAVFVSPVRIGLSSGQNRSYGDDNWYRRYVETPLSRLPNKIVILNEVSSTSCIWTTSMRQTAARYLACTGSCAVPRPRLDAAEPRTGTRCLYLWWATCSSTKSLGHAATRTGRTVAFLSSTHRTDVTGTIQRMLDDLEALIASGQRIARLVLKEHPGTESTDYRTLVRERCDRWRTELHACDKHQDLSDLQDTVDIALVQDSLTSHWRCGGTALSPSCTARAGTGSRS